MEDSSRCSSAIKDFEFEEQPAAEESGWTSYFEDFERMNYYQTENNIIDSYCSTVSGGGGTASRAGAATDHATLPPPPPNKLIVNLRKKSRADQKAVSDFDDSLEDTATSPVSSPKMGSLMRRQTKMKRPRELEGRSYENKGSHLGKAGGPNNNYFHQEEEALFISKEEGHEISINIDDDDQYAADLRKRGLCLVPFSTFANYSLR